MPPGDALRFGLSRLLAATTRAIDWALPPRCLTCDEPALEPGTQCAACFRGLGPLRPPFCDRCGVPLSHAGQARVAGEVPLCPRCAHDPPPFSRARAAYWYDEASKRLILPFKHGDRPEIGRFLARRMAAAGAELLSDAQALVPVPLHPARLRTRRYNQAAVLAAGIARIARVPSWPDALRRVRTTPSLGELDRPSRHQVLERAIGAGPGLARRARGCRVILVDDVLTSGATASACARVLLEAGADTVDVLAVARVPDRRWIDA